MAAQVTPTIAAKQDVYDYLAMTSGTAAATLLSGTITGNYIQTLLNRTAWMIVNEINRDYGAPTQNVTLQFFGNDRTYITVQYPFGGFTGCHSWDPNNPSTVTDEGTAFGTPTPSNNSEIWRTDGAIFSRFLEYGLLYQTAPDIRYAGWPQSIVQIQVELVAKIFSESRNDGGLLMLTERETAIGRPLKLDKELWKQFQKQLRPYKIFP